MVSPFQFTTLSVCMLVMASAVHADISAGNGSGTSEVSQFVLDISTDPFPSITTRGTWIVTDDLNDDPFTVVLDESAGPWIKEFGELEFNPEQGPTFGNVRAEQGDVFGIVEYMEVGGSSSWNFWEEQILTDDWEWTEVSAAVFGDRSGTSISDADNLAVTATSDTISFSFDTITPGSMVGVMKLITYTGANTFDGVLQVQQYPDLVNASNPIPAPGSAGLCLLGMGVVFGFRKRQ